jgi:hypothetical protein
VSAEAAAIGDAIERLYRSAPVEARPEMLTLIGRAVGAALARVDGRERQTEIEPTWLAPYDQPK